MTDAPGLGGQYTGMEPSLGGQHEATFFLLLRKSSRFFYYMVVRSLANRGSRAAMDSLYAALRSPKEVSRAYAANALGWIADPEAAPHLVATLHDPSRYVREVAVWALIKIGDGGLSTLKEALDHVEPRVRAQVALILGDVGTTASAAALLAAIDDPERDVRRAVNLGLYVVSNEHPESMEQSVTVLCERFRVEPEADIRSEIVGTLGVIGEPVAVPTLIEALHDPDAGVRAVAAQGLGLVGDLRAVPSLITALADTTEDEARGRVCDSAAEALKRMPTADAIRALERWHR